MTAADTSYMKEKPVLSLLLSMGIPMMLSMLINSLYNIVDGIFVARMSEDAMMAISLVYPVQNLLHSIAVGFGVGTNAVIAIFLGSRKGDAASSAASQGILLNLCHGLLFMVFGILFMRPFLDMFTSNETVIAYGMQYGIIVLCFSMIHTTELSFEKIFQSVGRMKTSMISLGSSCMINIILDPLLIFGIGPFPALGVAGAAVATVIAQGVSVVLCILYIMTRVRILIPGRKHLDVGRKLYWDLFSQSISMGLMSSIVSAGSVILQYGINGLGTLTIAGHTAARKLFAFTDMPLIAMANAASTFVSQNYGAGQPERIRKGMREIYLYSLVVMVVTVLLMQVSAEWLVRMVSGSSEALVLENGARYLRWTSPFYAVLGVLLSTRYALQSLGEKVLPLFSSVIEFLGKVVFVLVFIPRFAYNAVILCEPVIWCFMALYLVAVYRCNPFVFPKKQ